MPRIRSLNILLTSEGKDYLAELYGNVIEAVSAGAVSTQIKNVDLSGDFASGSVEAKRIATAKSKAYGTARTAGKGDALKAQPVVVAKDTDKEIVEEIEQKDTIMYGVDNLLARRSSNHVLSMISELDSAFFTEAVAQGTQFTPEAADLADQVEESIVDLESTKDDFVDGIPRNMITVVCGPKAYSAVRQYLQKNTRHNMATGQEDEFEEYNGCRTFKSVHLPTGIDFITLVDGSIAQPVYSSAYDAEKVPLSDAYAVELFYYYGTKAVSDNLIKYVGTTTSGTGGTGTGGTGTGGTGTTP